MTAQPLEFTQELTRDLQAHLALCQETLDLAARENQALASPAGYQSFEFYQQRKDLLPRLDQSLMLLRNWRQRWQEVSPAERARCPEVKALFQSVQDLLMKVLLLDRENQQALLRQGLLPARHLPAAAVQQPHCVADLYRRHSRR
ncbi:MAG TPA: hypothetical protein VNZ22_22895 [Bacillota bacterium]|nr:hypothetical protein [Bacillota bacterium]